MRKALLLLWFVLPGFLYGQSTLNYPKLFSPAELGLTGFAIVNPGPSSATATFTLRSSTGVVLSMEDQTIPSGGQLARLGNQLFPGVSEGGWVQVTSATTGLTGAFLTGDFQTQEDGADPAPSSGDIVLPLVTANTEINVANTASTPASLTLSLRQADGTQLSSSAQTVAAMGVLQAQASLLFPGVDLSQATHVLVTGGTAVAATAVFTDFLVSPALGVLNGTPTSSTLTELNFSHVISGPLPPSNYVTSVGVTNLNGSANTVSITFTPTTGSPTTAQRTIAANGSLRESADSLFNFPAAYQDGWVQVTSASPVTGYVAYADSTAGALAIVPVPAQALERMIFGHVAQAANWFTGVALLNTSTTETANVEIYTLNTEGGLVGGALDAPDASFTIGPRSKTARLINEWIPAANSNGGFVFVRTTNGVPLFGMELFFFLADGSISLLSNVAPGAVADGVTYTPPNPAGVITLDSISPATAARSGTVTLSGAGFSSGDTAVFTTPTGTTSASSTFVSSTSLTATVPSTAISGPVFVQSGSSSSSGLVLDVTQSATALVQTPVQVDAGQTVSGADIFVPLPVGSPGLNLEAVGAGERTQGISAAASSLTLQQGQVTDLLIVGTGISLANGSMPSVTGEGLTFSNLVISGGNMFVQVTVSANATPGLRTLTLTNSNFDTSALSGGIIIQ